VNDPAAELLPERRYLMKLWEDGEDVDEELRILDAEIVRLRLSNRTKKDG
jgi:hypothetical protein